ncbi:polycystin-1 isoform X2, partial [Biomphalaria pfeifferi]
MRPILSTSLTVTIVFILTIEVAESVFIGCFQETVRNRLFSISPGNYEPGLMKTTYCQERCGKFDYPYAALAEGKFCFCSQSIPGTSSTLSSCNMTCSGMASQTCGSINYVSVYSTIKPIVGLQVSTDIVGLQEVPKIVTLSVSFAKASSLVYRADYDDQSGFTGYNETGFKSRAVYLPGTYSVRLAATDDTQTIPESYAVTGFTLHQAVSGVEINCDQYFATHEIGRCEVVIWRGTDLELEVNVTDRNSFDLYLEHVADPIVSFVGQWPSSTFLTATSGYFLMKSAMFTSYGKVYSWRIKAQTAGSVTVLILAPGCGAQRYCFESNQCKASCLTSNLSLSTQCSSTDSFCSQDNSCSSTCPAATPKFGAGLSVNSYIVKWSAIIAITTTSEWYNMTTAFPDVQPGYIIGLYHHSTGRVAEVPATVPDFVVTSTITTNGTSLSTGSDCNYTHAIQAMYSVGSKTEVTFQFLDSPGVITLNTTARNKMLGHAVNATTYINLLEGVDIALIVGPQHIATRVASNFTVAPHTGSNLTYHWNITGVMDAYDGNLSLVISTPGIYELNVAIFNAISKKSNSTIIYAEDELIGLTMTAPSSAVNTPVTFTINLSGGTNYTCDLDYGDTTATLPLDTTSLFVGVTFTQIHTYTALGVYTVLLLCNNNVSADNVTFDIFIQEVITNLKLVRLGAPTFQPFKIGWSLSSGTSVSFNVTFNTTDVAVDSVASNIASYTWESVILSGRKASGYPYTITAWNKISSLNISGVFKIMDPIENPTFTSDLKNVTTDDVVTFTVDIAKGSDVTVVIHFADKSPDYTFLTIPEGNPWPGTLRVNHTFINGCNCSVVATISNAAGSVSLTVIVLVRVGFSTIQWTLPSEQYYLYEPPASLNFSFYSTANTSPTEPTVEINWGDGSPTITTNEIVLSGSGYRYDLDDTLDYTINVTMYNLLGSKTFLHKAIVVEKLVNPSISVDFPCAPLNQPYNVTFKMYRGDQYKLTYITWDFGDNTTPKVTERQGIGKYGYDIMSVTYNVLGQKTINITATAPLNQSVSDTLEINVINGVDPTAVLVLDPASVSFGATTSFTVEYIATPLPTSAVIEIYYYGDRSLKSSEISLTSKSTTLSYIYTRPGRFLANIIVRNNASLVEKVVQVGVYEDFINLKVQVTFPGKQVASSFQDTPGLDASGTQFPLDVVTKFTLTDDKSALALSYELTSTQGPAVFTTNFSSNGFIYKFQQPGKYFLTLTASNPLYSRSINTVIELVQRVKSMTIKEVESLVEPGYLKQFNVSFSDYGQDTCVYIDWGNGVNKSIYGDNLSFCVDPSFSNAVANGNMNKLITELIGIRYLLEGIYTVKFIAQNAYGRDSQEVSFPISRAKCSKPTVYIDQNTTIFYNAPRYKRANIIRLRGMASIECPTSLDNIKLWTLDEVNNQNGSVISSINIANLVIDKAELYIPARSLPVGLYKATYNVAMNNNGIYFFNNSAFTYFQIIQSPLVAIIVNGGMTGITRGSQQFVALEPLRWSLDPDVNSGEPHNLTVKNWTCFEALTPSRKFPCNFTFNHTADKLNISGATLKQNYTYIFQVTVAKDNRLATAEINVLIQGKSPPAITIRCLDGSVCYPNTLGFIILESSRVSFDCSCPDCSPSATYQWGVSMYDYRWNDEWRPVKDSVVLNQSISLTSKQLSLEKSLLKSLSKYVSKLRIQCKIDDVSGNISAETQLIVNKPPSNGNCSIQPMNKTATIDAEPMWRVECNEWNDTDGIKEFQFFSVFDPEEVEREITSYPLPGGTTVMKPLSINVSLPVGPDYKGYRQNIKAVIRDTLNAVTELILSEVIVLPPETAQLKHYITQMVQDPNFELYTIFQVGDQREVTELATAFVSALNTVSEGSPSEYEFYDIPSNMICTGYGSFDKNRKNAYLKTNASAMDEKQYKFEVERDQRSQLRTKIITFALNTTFEDPIAIQQVAGLLAVAAAQPTEITPDCMDLILEGISKMIENLNDPIKMADIPQEVIEKAMTNIFSVIGAMMEAAGANGNFPTLQEMEKTKRTASWKFYDTSLQAIGGKNDVESIQNFDEAIKAHTKFVYRDAFVQKGIEAGQKINILMKSMSKLFNSFAIPGQVMNGTSFRLKYSMEKNYIDKFTGKTVKLSNSDAEVVLPNNIKDLFPGLNKTDVVTFQVSQSTNVPNRYSDSAIESFEKYTHFVSMNFYGKNGDALRVVNTSSPIKITIPHDSNGPRGSKKIIRPFVTQWNMFQLHQTETKSANASIHLHFEIEDGVQLLVVARYNGVPNPANNETDFIFVVPPTVPPNSSLKDPYTIVITNVELKGRKGKWWFGTRELDASDINDAIPTNEEIAEKYKNGSGEFNHNYNLTLWTSGCFFLSDNATDWSTYGCEVSPESTEEKTVCLCNHMTTFAGGFIVVPNTIDWNFVFSHADFMSNPTLYITEMFIAVVFAIAFYLARQKDKKDMALIGLTPMADNDPRDKYFYEVIVSTGMRRNAGTNSKVYFILSGEEEESEVRMFSDSKRPIFKRGMTNRFLLALPECLGHINYMRVWHDNSGKGKFGSWFLNYIVIKDLQTDVKQVFIANRWFALEEDDGQIDRILSLAGREQLADFSYQFGERTRKNLVDGHLWFSVVARPPGSYFTCVERVACCLCLLFMTMLTNAMFYRSENNSSNQASLSFSFGPFSLSVSQIFIGFISNIIVFPVNFLIVFLFRKAKPRNMNPSNKLLSGGLRPSTAKLSQVHPHVDSSSSTLSLSTTASYPDGRSDFEQLVKKSNQGSLSQSDLRAASLVGIKKKKSCQLAWWFKIVAWVLVILCTLMSAALVTFYGISFQDDTCKKWITSLIVSFFTSIFITQPIK